MSKLKLLTVIHRQLDIAVLAVVVRIPQHGDVTAIRDIQGQGEAEVRLTGHFSFTIVCTKESFLTERVNIKKYGLFGINSEFQSTTSFQFVKSISKEIIMLLLSFFGFLLLFPP